MNGSRGCSHGTIPSKLVDAELNAVYSPPEVPKCAVEHMFEKVSSGFKEQISEADLCRFSDKHSLGYSTEKISDIFAEALSSAGFNYSHGLRRAVAEGSGGGGGGGSGPRRRGVGGGPRLLTVPDVRAALRTRRDPRQPGLHTQRPFRDEWIRIIQTAHGNKRIFTFPTVHALAAPLTLMEQWSKYEEDLKAENKPLFQPQLFEPRFDPTESVFATSEASVSAFTKSMSKLSTRPNTQSRSNKQQFMSASGLSSVGRMTSPVNTQEFQTLGEAQIYPVHEDGDGFSALPGPGRGSLSARGRPTTSPDPSLPRPSPPAGGRAFARPGTASPSLGGGGGGGGTFRGPFHAGASSPPGSPEDPGRPFTGGQQPWARDKAYGQRSMLLTRASTTTPRTAFSSRTLAPGYVSAGGRSVASVHNRLPKRRPYNPVVDGVLPPPTGNPAEEMANELNEMARPDQPDRPENEVPLATQKSVETFEDQSFSGPENSRMDYSKIQSMASLGFEQKGQHDRIIESLQGESVERRKSTQARAALAARWSAAAAAAQRGPPRFRSQMGARVLEPQRFRDRQEWAQESLLEAEKRGPIQKMSREGVTRKGAFDYSLLNKQSEVQDLKKTVAGDQQNLFGRSPSAYYGKYDQKPYSHYFRTSPKGGQKTFKHQAVPVSKSLPHENISAIDSNDGVDYVRHMREGGWKLDKIER